MASLSFPHTHIYYACPCSDLTSAAPTFPSNSNRRASIQPAAAQQPPTFEDQRTFNPHSPRANAALYPLDTLFWCDECDVLRCPRCVTDEVLYWYCPSCLFDVPSSAVRGDGCRCSRSCYDCPSCTAPLAVTQIPSTSPTEKDERGGLLKPPPAPGERPAGASGDETYILQCQYCDWSSLEIDVQFNKPTKITEQLARQRKARTSPAASAQNKDKEAELPRKDEQRVQRALSLDETFTNLMGFYKDQLSESGDSRDLYPNSPYTSSPANLQRIMSLYGGLSHSAQKKMREKPQPMREALSSSEGLTTYLPISASPSTSDADADADTEILQKMQHLNWDGTTSTAQRLSAPMNNEAKFVSNIWPVATPLRTRRGKRCKTCRQLLARPEPKVGNMRYRGRILAMQHIPRLSIKPLHFTSTVTAQTTPNAAFRLHHDPTLQEEKLKPFEARQYILTVRNPLFEPVKITLATPATTPGKVASKVIILCPSFTVGPAGEVWDDALSTSTGRVTGGEGGRKAAMASLTGTPSENVAGATDRQPEAGKIWQRTRNSTSVILEIVPGSLRPPPSIVPNSEEEFADEESEEDDDVLEVPLYVRVEWEVEEKIVGELATRSQQRKESTGTVEKVQKESGFWAVVGLGRIV